MSRDDSATLQAHCSHSGPHQRTSAPPATCGRMSRSACLVGLARVRRVARRGIQSRPTNSPQRTVFAFSSWLNKAKRRGG
eukprot:scaffold268862_cov30-Tisochrysis_lutea.AAC.3